MASYADTVGANMNSNDLPFFKLYYYEKMCYHVPFRLSLSWRGRYWKDKIQRSLWFRIGWKYFSIQMNTPPIIHPLKKYWMKLTKQSS